MSFQTKNELFFKFFLERLLCLSMIASLIFNQLLGSDLTDIKTEIFLPLVGLLSENQQQKEFRIIFLERLHKKCPYTIPYYPERQPTMDDKQYFEYNFEKKSIFSFICFLEHWVMWKKRKVIKLV
jgi:hypothetical protein